ncbi:2-C-methyl-D-erythritol 4-phosphate cytidylyltransferase [bacterium]|nr:MAG: 2-C-methyl-D-erythritol 4-phosphate cytidylyltransferase [bacterium]
MLSAILLAAGKGSRLNSSTSKPLVKINRHAVVFYSLRTLNKHPEIDEIIVVVNSGNQVSIAKLIKNYSFKKTKAVVLGGKRRQDSVYNGLKAVDRSSKWVLIHDSARPFIKSGFVSSLIRQAKKSGAAILAVKPKATIKSSKANNTVAKTFTRDKLWEVQTPQVFKKDLLLKAYKKYSKDNVTDDASLVEKLGKRVKIVKGSYGNIKITTNEDLLFAGLIAKRFAYGI